MKEGQSDFELFQIVHDNNINGRIQGKVNTDKALQEPWKKYEYLYKNVSSTKQKRFWYAAREKC